MTVDRGIGARPTRVAAVQLEVVLGDVDANLAECERLAREAARAGAQIVALPEFFSTGAGFHRKVAAGIRPPDGEPARLLRTVAESEGVYLGGSFLCRDPDGEVRNAYLLVGPDGEVRGRHSKDLPTMWENAFYVGGTDDGVIEAGPFTAGVAVCWEFMRSRTARRLRGQVDMVIGGSNWWSVPRWRPRAVMERMERANAANALRAPATFGRLVGAPVIHAAMAGEFSCTLPEIPAIPYRGHFQGGALVTDACGNLLAVRRRDEGAGFVVADVEISRVTPRDPVPDRYWLHNRGAMSVYAWHAHRLLGRRWYRRNVRT
jgi:predicted amidohydrolase